MILIRSFFLLRPRFLSTIFFIPILYGIGWALSQPLLLFNFEKENLSLPIKKPVEMLGHVTSSYFSPTLKHSVAMALIKGGKRKIGSRLYVSTSNLNTVPVEVVETSFIDPKNKRMML